MLDIFPRARRPLLCVQDPFSGGGVQGGGVMAERMRAFDWNRTALGMPDTWPMSLRLAVRWLLASPQPLCLWWGEDRVTLMNDACIPLLGFAHLTCLGMPAGASWRELWPDIGSRVERAFDRGEGFTAGPLAFCIERDGRATEAHFTLAATPVGDEGPETEGLLCAFTDVTQGVVMAREQRLFGLLAACEPARDFEAACAEAIATLAADPDDFPFAGLYVVDADGEHAHLAAQAGIAAGHALMPTTLALDANVPYPLRDAFHTQGLGTAVLFDAPSGTVPSGPWSRAPHTAALLPLAQDGRAMVLVAALNPFRPLDDAHRRFLAIVASQVHAVIARTRLSEDRVAACEDQELAATFGALRDSERIYRAIGESIQYGVWTADARGKRTSASASFLELLGTSAGRWSADWLQFVHPDDVATLQARWRECVATGAHLDEEYRVLCADGTYRAILGRGVPVRDERGDIVAWAGIHLDIGRVKNAENRLREVDRRKDEFIATLAHELRNPLAPLRNGLEVLRLANGNPEMGGKARAMMERQLGQMVRLLDDLLDVSRVSRGKIDLRREPVELATVLRNALETSQPTMSARGHDVVVSIPRESIVVDADATRLSQVFWNLLNNAAKYTEPGGRIELGVQVQSGRVAVSIRDNGIGISPEMHARVFDIFTQVDRALDKSQGGLGIGLSIAKRLVEMHGGTIRVKSPGRAKTPGDRVGSEFVVTLPATMAATAHAPATAAHPRMAGPSRRVLVADDNPDSAATLSLMLEVLGNEVRVAHDGEEAFTAAAEFHPDVILLDIGMPKLHGYGACQLIRAQPWGREPFIVALTGWAQEEDRARAKAAGFDRHLVKPVEPATLAAVIGAIA